MKNIILMLVLVSAYYNFSRESLKEVEYKESLRCLNLDYKSQTCLKWGE